jgi:hypothetical protein
MRTCRTSASSRATRVEGKEITYAHFRSENEGTSTGYTRQVYDTRSRTPLAKLWGELDPSLAAHDWK